MYGSDWKNRVRTFSWRLGERIIVCPVPGNDGAWWACIPPRRWPRPGRSSAWVTRPGSARNAGRQRIPGMSAIWPDPSSRRRRGPRRSNRCRAACGGSGPPNCSARASARPATGSRRIAGAAWPRCGPGTGRRPGRQAGDAAGSGRRRHGGPAPQGRGAGTGERGDAGGGGGRGKGPGHRPAAPVGQGGDAVCLCSMVLRPVERLVFSPKER